MDPDLLEQVSCFNNIKFRLKSKNYHDFNIENKWKQLQRLNPSDLILHLKEVNNLVDEIMFLTQN